MRGEDKQTKKMYKEMAKKMSEILFRYDPMDIACVESENFDEYDPEVSTILPRLNSVSCEEEALDVVFEEFNSWFSNGAGAKFKYKRAAKEIWEVWQLSQT